MNVQPRDPPTHELPDAGERLLGVNQDREFYTLSTYLFKSHHVAHDLRNSKIEYFKELFKFLKDLSKK